ncbi:MAG: MFS transporter [Steroidobacteraceae bacterium]
MRLHWPVVLGAFSGLIFSVGTLVVYTFSVFTPALAAEFGWNPLQIATALGLFNLGVVIASPLAGRLVDLHGGRRVVLVSTGLFGVGFAALALVPDNLPVLYAMFVALAVIGSGTTPAAYASVIVGWFDRNRGLALGLAMAGAGVGGAVLPSVIHAVIATLGWRSAYALLGASVIAIGLPVLGLLLRSPPRRQSFVAAHGESGAGAIRGALRQRSGWTIALFAFLAGVMLIGVLAHFVPVLVSKGFTEQRAAHFQMIFGLSVIAGRGGVGALLDRFFAPRVVLVVFGIASLGLVLLSGLGGAAGVALAAAALGLALGAEIDVLGYLISRYFAPAVFGTIYGAAFSLFTLGAAVGTVANGAIATRFGYAYVGVGMAAVGALVCLVTMLMPPYAVRATPGAVMDPNERNLCPR